MEPYCKVLPICYAPIQTSREFSVGQSSCFNHSLNVISSKESFEYRTRHWRTTACVLLSREFRTLHKIFVNTGNISSLDSLFF